MKHLAFVLMLILAFLAGCGAEPPEPGHHAVAIPSVGSSVGAQSIPPAAADMTSRLVPYKSELFEVSLSYPENLNKPAVTQTGLQHLSLDLGNGEFFVYREEAKPGQSLADLATENIDANTKVSNGRIVSKNLGRQTLGGEAAWGVQRYFDSAAGRTDSIMYIVLAGRFEYRVGCETKQGPPVIPWSAVAPVCARILETIRFSH